ncbi:hypothetical protein HDU97_005425 [Phlyctochytrium planicorne]|nr:hypothetical protein HDU97_005425 [Phlyctochytrium planicorne]
MSRLPDPNALRKIATIKKPEKLTASDVKLQTTQLDSGRDKDDNDYQVHNTGIKRKANGGPSISSSKSSAAAAGGPAKKLKPSVAPAAEPRTLARGPKKPASASASASTSVLSSSSQKEVDTKKKRPAWDVKGRLQDLEEYNTFTESKLDDSRKLIETLTEKLSDSQKKICELDVFKAGLENKITFKEQENTHISTELKDMKDQLKAAQDSKRVLEDNVSSLEENIRRKEMELQKTISEKDMEISSAQLETARFKALTVEQSTKVFAMESEINLLKLTIQSRDSDLCEKEAKIGALSANLERLKLDMEELENRIRADESVRRKLHNTIQELKGNIRVFCRIRPPLQNENKEEPAPLAHIVLNENDDKAIEIRQTWDNATGNSYTKPVPFSFDKVFAPSSTQDVVFEEISQLVQSALDGYNVCIFAYGQTGSGKTFTMEGAQSDDEQSRGMIPRAVEQIFASVESLKAKGWEYQFEIYFLEIYNETIRDLLGNGDKKHEVKHVGNKTTVTDITTVSVETPKEIHNVLRKATANRAVAATNSNERSSRSHSVFTLRLTGKNAQTGEASDGTLNLIDLAGSERLSSSGSTGERLKETQAINKSLSSLGDVIFALANKEAHVPYRNSKHIYLPFSPIFNTQHD